MRAIVLPVLASFVLVGCGGGDEVEAPGAPGAPTTAPAAASETQSEAAPPLAEEQRYLALLAIGLEHTYQLTPDDGTVVVLENMEGYRAISWTDPDGNDVIVTRRYVAGEPEEWVYVDNGVTGDGVTENSPTEEQSATFETLAADMMAAVGVPDLEMARDYAWLGADDIGTVSFTATAAEGGEVLLNFGTGLRLQRVDLLLPS